MDWYIAQQFIYNKHIPSSGFPRPISRSGYGQLYNKKTKIHSQKVRRQCFLHGSTFLEFKKVNDLDSCQQNHVRNLFNFPVLRMYSFQKNSIERNTISICTLIHLLLMIFFPYLGTAPTMCTVEKPDGNRGSLGIEFELTMLAG